MPKTTPPYRVAIVVPALATSGGVATVARFVHRVLREADEYTPALFSVPLASDDPASVRLRAPATWTRGVQVTEGTWDGHSYQHVGAVLSEFEFQRYRPRPALTRRLNQHDLVQVVAGTPAWALLCRNVTVPVALQAATLARVERRAALSEASGLLGAWRRAMARLTDWLDHRALRVADRVFVENQWMREHLADHVGPDRVVFAPPGIDAQAFSPGDTPPSEGAYVLSVGRFGDPRKNVTLLFEAYARLRDRMENPPSLVLAGRTGPPDDAWARARTLGVQEHVTFHADVPSDRLVDLYRRAALYVVSSDEEGLGLTLLEAMACGRPVVSTRCGGPSTIVQPGTNGQLCPIGSPDELAASMHDLLSAPARRDEMGKAARTRVETAFSVAATRRRFLDVYDDLLDAAQG